MPMSLADNSFTELPIYQHNVNLGAAKDKNDQSFVWCISGDMKIYTQIVTKLPFSLAKDFGESI